MTTMLQIFTVDLTGKYSESRFAWTRYIGAAAHSTDGASLPARDVAFSKAQIDAIRAAGDLVEITVEASLSSSSVLWHVDQIFLPGTPVMPARATEADANGNVSTIRADTDGGIQIQTFDRDGDRRHDIRVTVDRFGDIEVDSLQDEEFLTIPRVGLDHVIEALVAIRDSRTATQAV